MDFSSIVVKEAPSGMLLPQPMAAQASARATTAGAKRNLGPGNEALRDLDVPNDQIFGGVVKDAAEPSRHERFKEFGRPARSDHRIFKVWGRTHALDARAVGAIVL